jgi:F-type H+-transporting ATPase subunit b
MLNLDPGMMVWAWITFGVLLFILYKVAWKPILSNIDKREKTIQESLNKAQKAQEEAELLLEKHEQLMKNAEREAQNLLKENRELSEKSREEIINEAHAGAQNILDKAKAEIEKEKESALLALKAEIADLTIAATKKIIGEALDETKHRKLVDDFIQKMPKSTNN